MAAATRSSKAGSGPESDDLGARILEAALGIAEKRGWAGVRLVDVADLLDVPPDRILLHYRDLNGVADAWFLRAWRAMLAPKPKDFASRPATQRIEDCLLAWFDALASHRRVTLEMLRGKLHPPHPHHWLPMVFDLSRTIHWLREAALLPAVYGSRRANMEELGLTGLFLATLAVWCWDASPGQQRTRRVLRRRLAAADRLMVRLWGRGSPPGEARQGTDRSKPKRPKKAARVTRSPA